MGETKSDAELVVAATSDEDGAFAALFDRWFDRVFDVAVRILRDDGLAAETAQDVFLVAWRQLPQLEQPASFGGWVSRISRNKALNRLERERRSMTVGDDDRLDAIGPREDLGPGARLEAAEAEELVWAASAALGERDASILHLHLRRHLTPAELADELGVTTNNAHQVLFRMRKRLGSAIAAWVLWNHGQPRCDDLDLALDLAGISSFGAPAVRVIDEHADGCEACADRRTARLSPEALFSAIPLAVAAPSLKARAAGALELEGVPVSSEPSSGDGDDGADGTDGADGRDVSDASMSTSSMPVSEMAGDVGPVPIGSRRRRHRRALVTAAVAVILLVAGFVGLTVTGDGDEMEIAGDTTPVTNETSSLPSSSATTSPASSQPTTTAAPPPASGSTTTTTATTTTTTSTPTTTASTTTTTAAPAPVIVRFVATDLGPGGPGECATPSEHRIELSWSSTDADSATLGPVGGEATPVPTSGSQVRCAPPGTGFELRVAGPGGADRQTAAP